MTVKLWGKQDTTSSPLPLPAYFSQQHNWFTPGISDHAELCMTLEIYAGVL